MNDVSDRYWQLERTGGQHTKGKSFDTFAPLGPYIVTLDEIKNLSQLEVSCAVNGEVRQKFQVSDYIYNVQQIVSFLSTMFTLYPGDVVSMGSGPGTAGAWGNQYLKVGDTFTMQIDLIGKQTHQIISE
jgi:2-keto-4-pentenoate hydratase/2-oxohepta-3-ene-1,7-dioic acid hydratase in catechol pathway